MTFASYYIAVKSSLHSGDSTVFGLSEEEVNALSKKYGGSHVGAINGVIIKAPPIQLVNSLSELGYKVMSECSHGSLNLCVTQTMDELDFERGIWFAAQHNDIARVKCLISRKKDVNAEDNCGYTALHYASRAGHFEMCKFLILNGANVNALTRSGKVSPLHRCASKGHLDILKLLIHSGASVDVKDGDGKTILHRAAEGGHVDLIKEIIKISPCLISETDNRGRLPRDYVEPIQQNIFNFQ